MMALLEERVDVLHVEPGLGVTVVGHTTSGTPGHRLEVTVTTEGRIVLVLLLEVVLGPPRLVRVARVWDRVLHCIVVHHRLSTCLLVL